MGAPGEPESRSDTEHGTATRCSDPCGHRRSTRRRRDRHRGNGEQTGDGVACGRRWTDLATDDVVVQVVSMPEREGGTTAPHDMQGTDGTEAGGGRGRNRDATYEMGHCASPFGDGRLLQSRLDGELVDSSP